MVPNYQNLKKLGNPTVGFGGKTRGEAFHAGIDIANQKGTPIPAMTPGIVTKVIQGFQARTVKDMVIVYKLKMHKVTRISMLTYSNR